MKTPYKPTAIPIKKLDWESLIPRIGMAGGESRFVRHNWRINANCPPRLADKKHLSAACDTQRDLRATRVLQIRFLRHTCRTMVRERYSRGRGINPVMEVHP